MFISQNSPIRHKSKLSHLFSNFLYQSNNHLIFLYNFRINYNIFLAKTNLNRIINIFFL